MPFSRELTKQQLCDRATPTLFVPYNVPSDMIASERAGDGAVVDMAHELGFMPVRVIDDLSVTDGAPSSQAILFIPGHAPDVVYGARNKRKTRFATPYANLPQCLVWARAHGYAISGFHLPEWTND